MCQNKGQLCRSTVKGCFDSIWLPQFPLTCLHCYSGVLLPALDSTQINNLIWLFRTLANVVGEYFANEIAQSCGKEYKTEVATMG